jgi:hypothetical protein
LRSIPLPAPAAPEAAADPLAAGAGRPFWLAAPFLDAEPALDEPVLDGAAFEAAAPAGGEAAPAPTAAGGVHG